jgi:hypothetical protein
MAVEERLAFALEGRDKGYGMVGVFGHSLRRIGLPPAHTTAGRKKFFGNPNYSATFACQKARDPLYP